jgi:multicomponent Na+:H+ antiporter subunit F
VALDMLTAVAVCFSALTALSTGRSAFLDIGLGIVLINFVSTCAVAAFLERKGTRQSSRWRLPQDSWSSASGA